MIRTDHFIRFERVDSVSETPSGIVADLHRERLRIDVIAADLARIKISRGGVFDESPTYAVCVDPLEAAASFTLQRHPDKVLLTTESMIITLGLDPFRIDVHRADGSPVFETAQDHDGRYWAYATLNDAFTLRRRYHREDPIFGLGEKSGRHNRRGRDFTLWNTDVLSPWETKEFTRDRPAGDPRADQTSVGFDPFYVSIPFFYHQSDLTSTMAASFVDNGYRGAYEFTEAEEYRIVFHGGHYTEYVFAGPDMSDILTSYTWLTGRTAPPPIWSLGYHQCRWFRYTQDAVEAIAARHRADEVPCDAIWLDIEYMNDYRVFTWNTDRFPDAPGMLERLADSGFRVITIIDPGVKFDPGYEIFDAAVERDVLCRTEGGDLYIGQVWPGNTAFPDFVTEEARTWWGELNAAHVRSGLAGIWNDMNEPATGAIPAAPMRFGRGEYPHERYRNQYALLMAMATTAGLLEAMPERRTFVLSRAGFAGIQRYAANWMGDNLARWDHLALSIAMGSGLGISGQAFVGADIGGFQGNTNPELFLRWMQYGVLTPFCRNHSEITAVDQYAWTFGTVIEDHVRTAIKLRYRLMPYLYACFLAASETGAPVQRPLIFDHQYDVTVRDLDDQYLLGPDLLVAPVTTAGMTSRQVYLPAGDWCDWHTGEWLCGPNFTIGPTPMDRIPIYARGGAVIPMWPEAPPSTSGYQPSVVELHVFVPTTDGRHRSLLQEDDGLTFAALSGGCVRTVIELTRTGDQVRLQAEVTGDGYPEFARDRFRLVLHGATPPSITCDGAEVAGADARFEFPNTGTGFTVNFTASPEA